ncbi:hypothetical protein [Glaciecola sp. 33A]|jgi:hypothetical protein|uniref:hypothetical protein n=1 Tax=Glaciecola sp. 33A TaxID=2057807 RepID=UPI0012FF2EAB|nr:hypothetical protein [Glaciecola sp. 33A]
MNLTEKQCQGVLTVIRHLNDSLDAHKIRKNADTCLLELLSADYFASFLCGEEKAKFIEPLFLNRSEDNLAIYQQYFQYNDPITPIMQKYKDAVTVNQIMDQSDLLKTEIFRKVLSL